MSKFYVVSGYCGPDNYTSDNGPILQVDVYDTAEQVEAAYKVFIEDNGLDDNEDGENSQITFRVIEGVERMMISVENVTECKLK